MKVKDIQETLPILPGSSVEQNGDIVRIELANLADLMNSKCEFRQILAQMYKVTMVLHRLGCREEKIYALDKESEMQVMIIRIQKSYNTPGMLALAILSGSGQIIGGAFGIFGAFPGTAAGNALGKIIPLFDLSKAADKVKAAADLAKQISKVSGSVSGVAQGIGGFSKLIENNDDSTRLYLQALRDKTHRKLEDRTKVASEEAQNAKDAIRNLSQAESEAHSAATRITESRS